MLTDHQLKSKINTLWDKLWAGGLSNPLDAIEQLSYLIFLKRLDEAETRRERSARLRGEDYSPQLENAMRWSVWTGMTADAMMVHIREIIFP